MKVKAENTINLTNKIENESVQTNSIDDMIRESKFRLIQKTIINYLNRRKFKQSIKNELTEYSKIFLAKFDEALSSVYQNNLAKLQANTYDTTSIYHNENNNSIRIFKGVIAKYESNEIASLYKGELNIETEYHGFGILNLKNNSYYEGYWNRNIFSYFGRFIDETGCLHEGKFINGKLNGEGMKITQNGFVFKGNFVDNLLQGIGIEDNNEFTYEGNFENNLKSGKGKYQFKHLNESYEGISTNNDITGYGIYVWSNKDSYEGTFIKGKMHGKGKYKWPDGGEYEGDYLENLKEGNGVFKWSNGKIYVGTFSDGRPHGNGIISSLNGNKYEVEFSAGKIVSKTLITKD
jgi:hypothetical protein